LVRPCIKIKAIEGDALNSDPNFSDMAPHFSVESVLIHAEIARGIAKPDEAGMHGDTPRQKQLRR
jgi:hypothetical protein